MPTRKKTKDVAAYLAELQTTDIKGSVDDILLTCKVVRSAKESLSESDFRDLRDQCVAENLYSEKVWSKLLQIGLDDRLYEIQAKDKKGEVLPASYTTLHLIHCLDDEELNEAVADGVVHKDASQGALNRWIKARRFQGTVQELPQDFSTVAEILAPAELEEETLERFKGDLEKLVGIYGFKTKFGDDQTMVALRLIRSKDKSEDVAIALAKALRSTWDGAPDDLKKQFKLTSLEELVQAPMASFTGFLNKLRGGRQGFWMLHANDYIQKNALEYLKSASKGQRFNYRRRLKEVAEKHPHLEKTIEQTLAGVMSY